MLILVFRKINPGSQWSIRPPIMYRHLSLHTDVPRPLADWIKGKARDQQFSVSIVIRDQLIDAWQRENEARKRPATLDPVRQNLFITVALDALLASHTDGDRKSTRLNSSH